MLNLVTEEEQAAAARRLTAQRRQAAGHGRDDPPNSRAAYPSGYQQRDAYSMVQWVGDGLGNGLLGYVAVEAVRRAWAASQRQRSDSTSDETANAPDVFHAARQRIVRLYGREMDVYGAALPILPIAHEYKSDGSWVVTYRSDEPVTYTVTFRPRRAGEEWAACIRTTASRRE